MYAVVRSGGKQYRVEEGQQLEVERLSADEGSHVELAPVLVVDGDRVLATPDQLGSVKVRARVVTPEVKGPKITGFTYKPKSNQRRRWGHRQRYSLIEVTAIAAGRSPAEKAPAKKAAKQAPAKKAPPSRTTKKGTS